MAAWTILDGKDFGNLKGAGKGLLLFGFDVEIRLVGTTNGNFKFHLAQGVPFGRDRVNLAVGRDGVRGAFERVHGHYIVALGHDPDQMHSGNSARNGIFHFQDKSAVGVCVGAGATAGSRVVLGADGLESDNPVGVGFAIERDRAGYGVELGISGASDESYQEKGNRGFIERGHWLFLERWRLGDDLGLAARHGCHVFQKVGGNAGADKANRAISDGEVSPA